MIRSEGLTLGEAREQYFARNGLGDGGYEDRWARFKIGPIPVVVPNTAERRRSVRLHDLHHVVTGYATTWTGEAEIGGWEIASGCADHYAAWVLNLFAFAIGLAIAPRAVDRAFLRGRQCRNFYTAEFRNEILAKTVGAARAELGLDKPLRPPSTLDRLLFGVWVLFALCLPFLPVAAIVILSGWAGGFPF